MEHVNLNYSPRQRSNSAGFRLVRVVIFETLLVAIVGLLIWGVAWDLGFPTAGLVIAIAIWLTVSPVIEIATVLNYRKSSESNSESGN
jgi:nitrate reductase NapE component